MPRLQSAAIESCLELMSFRLCRYMVFGAAQRDLKLQNDAKARRLSVQACRECDRQISIRSQVVFHTGGKRDLIFAGDVSAVDLRYEKCVESLERKYYGAVVKDLIVRICLADSVNSRISEIALQDGSPGGVHGRHKRRRFVNAFAKSLVSVSARERHVQP